MKWCHNSCANIISGYGLIGSLENIHINGSVLIVTAPIFIENNTVSEIINTFKDCEFKVYSENIINPDIGLLDNLKKEYFRRRINYIIAIGGGSVIDTAKVLSVLLLQAEEVFLSKIFRDGLEVSIVTHIPVIAIPTTSGTGAECTHFATIWDNDYHKKYSLESIHLLPEYVILEPSLTLNLNWEQTFFTGLDAISHSIESLWNKNYNPVCRAYAKESIDHIRQAFITVLNDPLDIVSRTKMQIASTLSGMAINQTKTAIAHSISYPLSSRFKVPHGLASSFTIPSLYNYLQGKQVLDKDSEKCIQKGVNLINQLPVNEQLKKYVTKEDVISLCEEMNSPSRFGNFIVQVSSDDLKTILESSISD